MNEDRSRLVAVTLDASSIERGTMDQEHERDVAIYDLLESNAFKLVGYDLYQYKLRIGLQRGKKLHLQLSDSDDQKLICYDVSLIPFRGLLSDYFSICENHYSAIRTASSMQIEAIDKERRILHNEGATLLIDCLQGKIECDFDTSRRIFTLIVALHWKKSN